MYSLSHSRPKFASRYMPCSRFYGLQSPQILASSCTLAALAFSHIAELSENFIPPKFLGIQYTLNLHPLAPLELQYQVPGTKTKSSAEVTSALNPWSFLQTH